MTDEQLVIMHLEGDTDAFAEIVKRYQHALVYLAWSYVKNQEEAEDIAQHTFLRVFEALPTSRTDLLFKPWLFHICANLCKNSFKKKKSLSFSQIESGQEENIHMEDLIVSEELTPDEETALLDRKDIVQESLSTLPEKFRRVLLLRYMEELSYEEIARIVTLPLNTVKTHISRAKKLLKAKLSTLLS